MKSPVVRARENRLPPAQKLYVHGVTVEEWTARYGVEPFTVPCHLCGAPLTTTRPFVQGTIRGLEAERCECWPPESYDPDAVQAWPPFAAVRDPKYGDLFSGGDGRLDR